MCAAACTCQRRPTDSASSTFLTASVYGVGIDKHHTLAALNAIGIKKAKKGEGVPLRTPATDKRISAFVNMCVVKLLSKAPAAAGERNQGLH
jgi:hypothetical protein